MPKMQYVHVPSKRLTESGVRKGTFSRGYELGRESSKLKGNVLVTIVPPFIALGYCIIHMGIKATFQKVLEGEAHEVSNAYLVYSTVLDKDSLEPLVDIFFASDRIKVEELFLRAYPNAVETLIKSELVDVGVERAEGMLKFDLEDALYWELWERVGDAKILQVIKDAEANSGC